MSGLPATSELERLGVRRLSAGTAIAQAAYNRAHERRPVTSSARESRARRRSPPATSTR